MQRKYGSLYRNGVNIFPLQQTPRTENTTITGVPVVCSAKLIGEDAMDAAFKSMPAFHVKSDSEELAS